MRVRRRKLAKQSIASFYQILKFLKQQIGFKPQSCEYKAHLIVGPPKSGKTSLLYNSQYSYRFYKKLTYEYQHSTINWWLTRDQLYLDFPGQCLLDEQQCIDWLTIIKKSGLSQCIATCCWVVPMQDMLNKEYSDPNTLSLQRFCSLCRKILGFTPTLQIIISQCDHLVGFESFFEVDTNEAMSQPLGYTLPYQWDVEAIQQSHQQLIDNLNQQMLERLQYERATAKQLSIKDFLAQFQQVLDQLELDLIQFKKHSLTRQALSGVFFIGKTQDKHLFNDAILHYVLPKQPIARQSRLKKHLLKVTTVISLLFLTGLAVWTAWQLQTMSQTIQTLDKELQHYHALKEDVQSPQDRLQIINYLKQAQHDLHRLRDNSWSRLYGNTVDHLQQRTEKANQKLLRHLRPIFQQHLESILNNPPQPAVTYACLATYLMLQKQMPLDKAYVKHVITYLQNSDEDFSITPGVAKELFQALDQHPDYLRGHKHYQQKTVDKLKQQFNQLSPKQQAGVVLQSYFIDKEPLTLNLPKPTDKQFQLIHLKDEDESIASRHTWQAWQSIKKQHLFLRSSLAVSEGNAIAEGTGQMSAYQLASQLKQNYFKAYAHDWQKFRKNIVLRQPHTIKQAQKALTTLTSQPSIMVELGQLFHNQIPDVVQDYLDDDTRSLLESVNDKRNTLQTLQQDFQGLRDYIAGADQVQQAFHISRHRMLNEGKGDALAKLHQDLSDVPEYWQGWSKELMQTVWQLLLKNSADYITQQWRNNIWPDYKHQLQNHFPFNKQANRDVKPISFEHFFAPHQKMMHFYHQYLKAFVTVNASNWRYRSVNGEHLPLKQHTLELFHKSHQMSQTLFNDHGTPTIQLSLQLSSKVTGLKGMLLKWPKQTLRLSVPSDEALKHMQKMTWQYHDSKPELTVFYFPTSGSKTKQDYQGFWGLWHWLAHYQMHSVKPHYWRLQGQSGVFQHKLMLHFDSKHPMFNPSYFQKLPFRRSL